MSGQLPGMRHRLAYTDWGNKRSLEALQKMTPIPTHALGILSHVVLSQMTWFDRVQQRVARRGFWDSLTASELALLISESTLEWQDHLLSMSENSLNTKIPYMNSRGESFESTLAEIVTHIINHSTYHRGQVALLIRQAGGEPPMTDFIVFARGR